jgi:hypothetical protein
VVVLPLFRQPGHGGRRQAGRRAEELLQRGHEVSRGQTLQVEQRQHLADLGRLAAPRREDLRGEPLPHATGLVDAAVVHPRSTHLDRAGGRGHGAGAVVAVAHHQASAAFIPLGAQLGYILIDFHLQGSGEHPPGAFPHDLVDQGSGRRGTVFIDYAEHGRAFLTRAATRALTW